MPGEGNSTTLLWSFWSQSILQFGKDPGAARVHRRGWRCSVPKRRFMWQPWQPWKPSSCKMFRSTRYPSSDTRINTVLYWNWYLFVLFCTEPRETECKIRGSYCGYCTLSAFIGRQQHSETIVWAMASFWKLILKTAVFKRQIKLINLLLFIEFLSL